MDRLTEQAALLALLRNRKSGWGAVADAVEIHGSAVAVLMGAGQPQGQSELFADDDSHDSELALEQCRHEIEAWTRNGLQLVTLLDPEYPSHLLTIHQRPPFLFYQGHLDPDDERSVAVVGTRKPSAEGLQRADDIAAGLARREQPSSAAWPRESTAPPIQPPCARAAGRWP